MAKVAFSKLGLKINTSVVPVAWNDLTVEVRQYLPHNDKLRLITDVMNKSADSNLFMNPAKVDMFLDLGILEYYTNLSFTEKQKEDFLKTYDSVISSGFMGVVREAIPNEELILLIDYCNDIIREDYHQKNSAMGIMESIGRDYKNTEFDVQKLQENMANNENFGFLKEVMEKMV